MKGVFVIDDVSKKVKVSVDLVSFPFASTSKFANSNDVPSSKFNVYVVSKLKDISWHLLLLTVLNFAQV